MWFVGFFNEKLSAFDFVIISVLLLDGLFDIFDDMLMAEPMFTGVAISVDYVFGLHAFIECNSLYYFSKLNY